MSLRELIRGPAPRKAATAIPAIAANDRAVAPPTVAELATGAVASLSREELADPADAIVRWQERVAIICEAGDLPEPEAHSIANVEAGVDIETLARRQVAYWRRRIESLPAGDDHRMNRLRDDVLRLLDEPWAYRAAMFGWDEIAMLGVHARAPMVRVECWGLAISVAASPFNDITRNRIAKIVYLGPDRAVIETPTGSRLLINRLSHGLDAAVPVWNADAFRRHSDSALSPGFRRC
jgi:hypothetical protein